MATTGNDGRVRKASASRLPKAERERLILHHAMRRFVAQTYATTTLEQIASDSGVSLGVIRKSFQEKSAILGALIESWPGWFVRTDSVHSMQSPTDFPAALHAFAERFLAATRKDAHLFQLITKALTNPSEPEELEIAHLCLNHAIAALTWLLQAGQQAGIFRRSPDALSSARDCFRFLIGTAILPIHAEPEVDEPPVPILETFLHGILKLDV